MIEFYRGQNCAFSDEVVEKLQAMVVAHKIHWIDEKESQEPIPRLVEGKKAFANQEAINIFLAVLNKELVLQREMQSDSCKIDPDTGKGCL
ncbi:MAG: hypothetical protein AB8G77_05545 [Rhodothermales bacterium]